MVVYSFGYGRIRSLVWTGVWVGHTLFPERAKPFMEAKSQLVCIDSMAMLASGADYCDFTSAVLLSRGQKIVRPERQIYALYGITRLLEDGKQWPKVLIPNTKNQLHRYIWKLQTNILRPWVMCHYYLLSV